MRDRCQRLKKRFQSFVKSGKSTAHKLNYFTLNIESEEITRDLYNHSLDQKISIFWVSNIFTFVNFITSIVSYFSQGKEDIGNLVMSIIYLISVGPVFALFRWRFKRAIRFIPVIIFFVIAFYLALSTTWYGG